MTEQFLKDVDLGLSKSPKELSSKYFYDARGDALFVKIMAMPEYYLTRAEHAIFKDSIEDMVTAFNLSKERTFEIIELGAGDGTKTKELLSFLDSRKYMFQYIPVDISRNALENLEASLKIQLPDVQVRKRQGDYFEVLDALKNDHKLKIVLFLGSNIGNLSDSYAKRFLEKLERSLNVEDKLLLGVDLIKSKDIVLPAYDDSQGITSAFNLNLLERINRELGGNFNTEDFEHYPEYDEAEGIARSYLKSKKKQSITIAKNGKTYHFEPGEKIKTEISRKYNDTIIKSLISNTSFEVLTTLKDKDALFADYIFEKKGRR